MIFVMLLRTDRSGVDSYLIDSSEDLEINWFEGKKSIGVTSGASAPEHLVNDLLDALKSRFNAELLGGRLRQDEGIFFKLPKELRS